MDDKFLEYLSSILSVMIIVKQKYCSLMSLLEERECGIARENRNSDWW
jgi:hypothetical protein